MADAVSAGRLTEFAICSFVTLGVRQAGEAQVASLVVEADLMGCDTDGLFRLRQHVNRLRVGGREAAANPRRLRETAATARIGGLRHLAIAKARSGVIGWVGVRGNNHAGSTELRVRPQADAGMISICAADGSANQVAPFGGKDVFLDTNPVAIATPGEKDPFVIEMSPTVAAIAKIKAGAQQGEPMPEGWMVGRDGKPLTGPARREDGFFSLIFQAKGYGLALDVGSLARSVSGAAFGMDVIDFTNGTTTRTNKNQFVAALHIVAFGEPAEFLASAPAPSLKCALLRLCPAMIGCEFRVTGTRPPAPFRRHHVSSRSAGRVEPLCNLPCDSKSLAPDCFRIQGR